MAKKKKEQSPEQLEAFESALTRTERFIEDNQKIITIVVLVIVGLVAAYMGIKRFYLRPLDIEAQSQMFVAERYFEQDSFELALYGDGNYFGFVDIADDYTITRSGNLANYYAGIAYLQLGEHENAIAYLKDFKAKGKLVGAIAYGALGDAYMEIGETGKAVDYYMDASTYVENKFTSPLYLIKAGRALELLGDYKAALEVYTKIKAKYPDSSEGRNIDKLITRAELRTE